jgi:hypothetical protein
VLSTIWCVEVPRERNLLEKTGKALQSKAAPLNPERGGSVLWAPLLAIAAAALAVEIPFFFFGTPSGHDVDFHLYSWLEVLAQWKQGIVYPRWAAQAHFGYGEPRFIFYPPASWTLGGLLAAILPWTIAPAVYIWMALGAAGVSMFTLARKWLDRRDAIFAAVLYAANPYHLVIVYWRSAFAELLASCLVPLLVLAILRVSDGERRVVLPLALVLAAAWLTNAPAAVMIHYSLALLLVFFAWETRSLRVLLVGAAAVGLSACLAAFYLFPAIYEQKWVNIAEAVSVGSRPVDNFIFLHTGDAAHDAFNKIISWVAALEIVGVVAGALSAKLWRKEKPALWSALLGWGIACSVLMFPVAGSLWKLLPKLAFMQFPWRWLLCLSMISAIFVTMGARRWWTRAAVCAVGILLIVGAWHRIQPPWWDNAGDIREVRDNMDDSIGYPGTDEYTPAGIDPSDVEQAGTDAGSNGTDDAIHQGANEKIPHKVTGYGVGRVDIHVYRWDAASKMFTAQTSAPDQVALRLFPYPAWRVEVNGRVVQTTAAEGTGEMLVPVDAGLNRVQITFVRTWDRTAGEWVSGFTAVGLLFWTLRARGGEKSRTLFA